VEAHGEGDVLKSSLVFREMGTIAEEFTGFRDSFFREEVPERH
jgi:hypothetical protein